MIPKDKKWIWKLVLLFLVLDWILPVPVLADNVSNIDIQFNEIMYNPPSHDNNKEFIELISPSFIDLTNFSITYNNKTDLLVPLKTFNVSSNASLFYYVIVEQGFDISSIEYINGTIYSVGERIGANLDNTHDFLLLYDVRGYPLANASYNNSFSYGNGKSLEWFEDQFYESVIEGGTPGKENSFVFVSAPDETNATNETITIQDCVIPEFIINTTKTIYDNKEKIPFKFIFDKDLVDEFSITYSVEDLSGQSVRSPFTTANANQKSFTPSIDRPNQALLIRAVLETPCGQNNAEKLIAVRNGPNPGLDEKEDKKARSRTSTSFPKKNQLTNEERKIDFSLVDFDKVFVVGEEKNITLVIKNNHEPHSFVVWSYVYRGSKSYSGGREENKQTIDLKAGETAQVVLANTVGAEPGEYKFKVKIRRDALKSTTDLTEEVIVEGSEEVKINTTDLEMNNTKELDEFLSNANTSDEEISYVDEEEINEGGIVYQSTSSKIKGAMVYFMIGLLMVVILVFVWKL